MEDLLLTKDELEEIENSPIFTLWLFGNIDESKLTNEEKQIIFARQIYYDLSVPDEMVFNALECIKCYDLDELLNNKDNINKVSKIIGKRSDIILTKVVLMKKRLEKSRKLSLTKGDL